MSDSPLPSAASGPTPAVLPHVPSRSSRLARGLLFVLLAAPAVWFGAYAWKRWEFLRLQAQCLEATLPADRPMFDEDLARSAKLVAQWPTEYRLDNVGHAERHEPRWAALAGRREFEKEARLDRLCILFMHERLTPSGKRRLVVISSRDSSMNYLVYEPGGFFADAKLVGQWGIDDPELFLLHRRDRAAGFRYDAGVPDPADPSRFSIPIVINGATRYLDGQLDDEDRLNAALRAPP